MDISAVVRLPFPRSVVYAAYRDEMLEIVPYLPNVRQVELKARREADAETEQVTVWHGGGSIPGPARAFLSEDLLSWTDYARWSKNEFIVSWRTETHAFTEAVRCSGRNHFIEEGDGTRVESRARLDIDKSQLKGVPSFLAGSLAGTIEDLIGKQIGDNFEQMGKGIHEYLKQRAPGSANP